MPDRKKVSTTVGQVFSEAQGRYPELTTKWPPEAIRDWERLAEILGDVPLPPDRKAKVTEGMLSLFRNLPKKPEVFAPLATTGSPGHRWRKK